MLDWLLDALSWIGDKILAGIYAIRDFMARVLGEASRFIFAATMFLGVGLFSTIIGVFEYTPVGDAIRGVFENCVNWTNNGPFIFWLFVDVLAFDELLPLVLGIASLEIALWFVQLVSAPIRRLLNSV